MGWHCIYTNPQAEGLVEAELVKLGFEIFAPRLEIEAKSGELKSSYLFPRYLFVALNLEGHWQPARYARGVKAILGARNAVEGRPTPISDFIINEIKARCTQDNCIVIRQRLPAAGDTLKVLAGPFANFQGMCLSASHKRVEVLLSLFGRQSHAAFHIKDIEVTQGAAA